MLNFAKQQREQQNQAADDTANPADCIMKMKPVSTLTMQSTSSGQTRQRVGSNDTRLACAVLQVSGQLWNGFMRRLQSMIHRQLYEPCLLLTVRKYDETPLKVRADEGSTNGKPSAGLAAKIYQTEFHICALLKRVSDGTYIRVAGQVPTALQVVSTNSAQNVLSTQIACESLVPELDNVAKLFPLKASLPCTDAAASNFAAEVLHARRNPGWVKTHTACQIHKTSTCTKGALSLVDGHISGVLAIGIATQFSGSISKLRKILYNLLEQRLEIRIGPPCAVEYRHGIYDVVLDPSLDTSRSGKRGRTLTVKRQREVLATFLNGDIQEDGTIVHWSTRPVDRAKLLQCMQKWVVPALVPSVCPKLNRGSWLGHEGSLNWVALLALHHNLLQPLLFTFCNFQAPAPAPAAKVPWLRGLRLVRLWIPGLRALH